MDKKTPLYQNHVDLKGKIVPFGGYELPVQYGATGLVKEHMAVRQSVGLFDVSHMGEIFIEGPDAFTNVQYIFTNDFKDMADGQIKYTLMCNESGGIIDDLILYKYHDQKYMAVVNASNLEKDFKWIKSHITGNASAIDRSEETGLVALQGPKAKETLEKLVSTEDLPSKYYTFKEGVSLKGITADISETGYTGESGYEIYTKAEDIVKVWELLLEAGEEFNIVPCGLGARDTLRLEAGMPLYGHEMTEEINPLQVGLRFAVKLKKDDFLGKKALEENKTETLRVGLKITGKGIVREDAPIFVNDKEIGISTSGTHAPFLGYAIAMALVDKDYAEIGQEVEVEVRKRRIKAEVVPMPFYKK